MSSQFGPAFEAELAYHRERVHEEFRRSEPALVHWLRHRWVRRGGQP